MRAISPVIGTVVLVGVTVVLATVIGAVVISFPGSPDPAEPVAISAAVSANGEVALFLDAGGPIDVRDVTLRVAVNGEPLEYQPPIPFSGETGFNGFPTGPFNEAADPRWTAGERTSFTVAKSNPPGISAGARVRIRIVVGEHEVADIEEVAR